MSVSPYQSARKPLTIYKAGAGSGKTFTLALEYILLLIRDPQCYRSILAVTFTNKATEEMKTRILSQLYGLWKQLPSSQPYMEKITSSLALSPSSVSERAGISLRLLLHNYHDFRVETIDTFFQRVLRNLARELDLTAHLKVELNDQQIEQRAVDELIGSLNNTSIMLKWILDYTEENISEDRNWNVIKQIKKFGEQIFKESYQINREILNSKLSQKGFFRRYTEKLRQIRNDSKAELERMGGVLEDILEKNQISVMDFQHGTSGVCSYFLKLQKGIFDSQELLGKRVTEGMEDSMKWLRKVDRNPSGKLFLIVETCLRPLLKQTERKRVPTLCLYKSADLTLRHLNDLRLLRSIEEKVREQNEDADRFLLSDTQYLLDLLIEEKDSPFIFEKMGAQLEHIMIDEFQDTSTIQWKNFKVLLKECMSHAQSSNLIVGDVKQSIYRWRSGDWRLLNEIEHEFPNGKKMLEIKELVTNYRSDRHVIEFNNIFFKEAIRIEYEELKNHIGEAAESLRKAYQDVEQFILPEKPAQGYVCIELLPKEDYQERALEKIVQVVLQMKNEGIEYRNIAILVRSNHIIRQIADYFMQNYPDIAMVSDEAFCLDASLAVQMIVTALNVLVHPEDQLSVAFLAQAYQFHIIGNKQASDDLLHCRDHMSSLLPSEYVKDRDHLLSMPLYNLAERLYTIFQLKQLNQQDAYICAFFDYLIEFTKEGALDIDQFIDFWQETLHGKSIQSDEFNGIRLLTIHKSKGLEFDHVIIPFCDWQLEKSSTIWCVPQAPPFNELPLVPIRFSAKQMLGSIYEKDYWDEHLQNTVDNLNLLYVAFTRAKKSLYVMGKRGNAGSRSQLIEQVLPKITQILAKATVHGDLSSRDGQVKIEYGMKQIATTKVVKSGSTSDNIFLATYNASHIDIDSFENKSSFRQNYKNSDYIADSEGIASSQEYIQLGNILHQLFSNIRTSADIDKAVKYMEQEGVLYDHGLTKDKLLEMVRNALADKTVNAWFSDQWTLYRECSILYQDPITGEVINKRPDRVMISKEETIVVDFKFGKPRPSHSHQVLEYIHLLKMMGHHSVKGYVWYVFNNHIDEIK